MLVHPHMTALQDGSALSFLTLCTGGEGVIPMECLPDAILCLSLVGEGLVKILT